MTDKTMTLDGPLGPAAPEPASSPRASTAVSPASGGVDIAASERIDESAGLESITESAGVLPGDPIAEIAHALEVHAMEPSEAVERILDHSLDEIAGASLTASERLATREQVLALLARDPHLSGLRARLGPSPGPPSGPSSGPSSGPPDSNHPTGTWDQ